MTLHFSSYWTDCPVVITLPSEFSDIQYVDEWCKEHLGPCQVDGSYQWFIHSMNPQVGTDLILRLSKNLEHWKSFFLITQCDEHHC